MHSYSIGFFTLLCPAARSRGFQVQEVPVVHRELPGEEPQPETQHGAAPQAPVHPGPAQREADPHPAEGPHRPHQEEEGREG